MRQTRVSFFLSALLIFSFLFSACSGTAPTTSQKDVAESKPAQPQGTPAYASNTSSNMPLTGSKGMDFEDDSKSGERYAEINENPFLETRFAPLSTFSIDVDTAAYSNLRRFINDGNLPPKDAVRIEELVNYFEYDYPQPVGNVPFSVTNEVAACPWNAKHKIVSIGLQGKKIALDNTPPSNLVFLVDVSGSMQSCLTDCRF